MEVNRIAQIETLSERFAVWTVLTDNWESAFPKFTAPIKRKIAPLLPIRKDQRSALYAANGLSSINEYAAEAKRLKGVLRVRALGLAGSTIEAAVAAVKILKGMLDAPVFDFYAALPFCQAINHLWLPPGESDAIRPDVIALSFYFGLYLALWKGYGEIMEGLVRATEEAITDLEWFHPRGWEIRVIGGIGVARMGAGKAKAYFHRQGLEAEWLEQLADDDRVDGGVIVQPAVAKVVPIPISGEVPVSYCSGRMLGEPPFVLEDGETCMSLREALMWFDVTPFSPLKTHQRLSVY
jgi:hypothetical protein